MWPDQAAIQMTIMGEKGLRVYETITFEANEDKNDSRVLLRKFNEVLKPRVSERNFRTVNVVYDSKTSVKHKTITHLS